VGHAARDASAGVRENQRRLKVIISRGSGGRGTAVPLPASDTYSLVSAYPAHYARWREEGVTLTLSPVRLGRNPMLAGLKHQQQVLIRTHLEQTDADEALVLDSEGFITECCAANLLWRQGVMSSRLRWSRLA
jgi:4-amino-4-deoxychorismate lyase